MGQRIFSKLDRWIVGGCLLTLLTALYFLTNTQQFMTARKSRNQNLRKAGAIIYTQDDVRRRITSGVTWLPVSSNDYVFFGDAIFTGTNAQATLRLDGGGKIELGPESMVVLRTIAQIPLIEIQSGTVSSDLTQQQALNLKLGQRRVQIRGQQAKLRVTHSTQMPSRITVLEGKVSITDQASSSVKTDKARTLSTELTQNQTLEMAAAPTSMPAQSRDPASQSPQKVNDRVLTAEIRLVVPKHQEEFLIQAQPIRFEWQGPSDQPLNHIQISSHPDFKSNVQEFTSSSGSLTLTTSLPPGTYYWRVRNDAQPLEKVGAASEFTVIDDTPPLAHSPQDGQMVVTQSQSRSLFLEWRGGNPGEHFEFQLARDSEFHSIVASGSTPRSEAETPQIAPGKYFWRVRTKNSRTNSVRPWSRAYAFDLQSPTLPRTPGSVLPIPTPPAPNSEPTKLPAPETKPPEDFEVHYQSPDGPRSPLIRSPMLTLLSLVTKTAWAASKTKTPFVEWSKISEAQSYRIEISQSEDFSTLLVSETVNSLRFDWTEYQPGVFFWRVAAIDKAGKAGEFSKPLTLRILPGPPKLTSAATFEVEASGESSSSQLHPIRLQWSANSKISAFIITVGTTPNLDQPQILKSKKPFIDISLTAPGTYYWKVQSLDSSGEPLGSPSKVQKFEVLKTLRLAAPSDCAPNNKSFIFIGDAPAQLELFWKSDIAIEKYEIQISTQSNYSELLDSDFLQKGPWKPTRLKTLPAGKIYWRVRAWKESFFSPWTENVYLIVRKPEFLPSPKELNPKPGRILSGFGSAKLELNWSPVPNAKAYVLEVSETQDFSKVIQTSFVAEPKEQVSLPPRKTYFWRVTPAESLPEGFADIGDGLLKSGLPNEGGKIEIQESETSWWGLDYSKFAGKLQQSQGTGAIPNGDFTSTGSRLGLAGEKWFPVDNWGFGGDIALTTHSLTPSSGGALPSEAIVGRVPSAQAQVQTRIFFRPNLFLTLGIGSGYSPRVVITQTASNYDAKTVLPLNLIESIDLRHEAGLGRFAFRVGIQSSQPIENFGAINWTPSLEGRYRLASLWIGLQLQSEFTTSTLPQAIASAGQSGTFEVRQNSQSLGLKLGLWE